MTWKSILSLAAVAAMTVSTANAQTPSVSGVVNGGNIDWTVSFEPGMPLSSLGIEFALETEAEIVAAPVIAQPLLFQENIDGTDIINPGNNPFQGIVTEGISFEDETTSVVTGGPGGGATVDGFFAAIGSTDFGTGGPFSDFSALTFSTVGTGPTTVFFDVLLAQSGAATTSSGSETVMGGPMGPIGDTDGDGDVDLTDLFNVQNNFGGSTPPDLGDTDGDGDIDLTDLFNVQNNFGATSGAISTPEPSSVILLLASFVGVCFGRRRN